jgi:hypothetical protein
LWTRILQIGGNLIKKGKKINKKTSQNHSKNHKRRQFFREMSRLNQSVAVWQLCVGASSCNSPYTPSPRNLPVQKYIMFSLKKPKRQHLTSFILSENIHREDSD